ncbi:histidine phosphatase family protein [Actinosynnema sp. NPDC059797]
MRDRAPTGGGNRTVVHLLRHGEVHNPTGILYGRIPGFKLSERGRRQALTVAEHLADHDIAHVVASPLDRAQQTAAPIADSHRLELGTDERLIEADNRFEGLKVSVGDGALRSPKHWPKLVNPFLPSWGEPYLEIAHRMLGAVQRARAVAEGHEAVCVSHQLPIWTLRRFLEGKRMWHDPRRRECSLASLTSLVFEGEQLVRLVYTEPAGATNPRVTGA